MLLSESKINNNNSNEPMIFYHGTSSVFKVFDSSMSGHSTGSSGFIGRGFYFSTSKQDASRYGDIIMSVNLNVNNLLDLTKYSYEELSKLLPELLMHDGKGWAEIFEIKKEIKNNIKGLVWYENDRKGFYDVYFEYNGKEYFIPRRTIHEIENGRALNMATWKILHEKNIQDPDNIGALGNYFGAEQVRNAVLSAGYDAVLSDGTNIGDIGKEIVVFKSSQIKIVNEENHKDGGGMSTPIKIIDVPSDELNSYINDGGVFDFDMSKVFLKKYLGYNIVSEVGSGTKGSAFRTDKSTIIKITFSKNEAQFFAKLIGKKLKHHVDVYDVKQIGNDGDLFAIERGFLEGMSKDDSFYYRLMLGHQIGLLRDEFQQRIKKEIKGLTPVEEKKLMKFYDDFKFMMKELDDLGLRPNDFFPENLGIKDGEVACFDCKYEQGGNISVCDKLYKEHHEVWDKLDIIEKDICNTTCKKYSQEIVSMWDTELKEHFLEEEDLFFPDILNSKNKQEIRELIDEHKEIILLVEKIKSQNKVSDINSFCKLMKGHIKKEEALMNDITPDPYKNGGDLDNSENKINFTNKITKDEINNIVSKTPEYINGSPIESTSRYIGGIQNTGGENGKTILEPACIYISTGIRTAKEKQSRSLSNNETKDLEFEGGGDLDNSIKSTNFTSNITRHELQSIISGKSQVRHEELIQTTARYLRGSEKTSGESRKSYSDRQEERLISFIDANNLWYSIPIENYFANGIEQKVYLDPMGEYVLKANTCFSYDYNWSKYLDSLLINNILFPDTSYELLGFSRSDKGSLVSVVRQHYVKETSPTDLKDVEKFLANKGFVRTHPSFNMYENKELGIILGDLHTGNVLTKDDVLYFIDSVLFIEDYNGIFKDGGGLDDSKKESKFIKDLISNKIQYDISGKNKIRKGAIIEAITRYLRRSQSTSSLVKGSKLYKEQEAECLKSYIEEHNLWILNIPSKSYLSQGGEQKVYLIDQDNVVKTNNAVFYNYCWEDYFNSLLLHNYFFDDTAYELIGFIENSNVLSAVVKQPFIKATENTDLQRVKKFMADNGFLNNKNEDYKNYELGVILEDLHDGNVLTKDGLLYFVDTFFSSLDISKEKLEEGGSVGGEYRTATIILADGEEKNIGYDKLNCILEQVKNKNQDTNAYNKALLELAITKTKKMKIGGNLIFDEYYYLGFFDKNTKRLKAVGRLGVDQIGEPVHTRMIDNATDKGMYIKHIPKAVHEDYSPFIEIYESDIEFKRGGSIEIPYIYIGFFDASGKLSATGRFKESDLLEQSFFDVVNQATKKGLYIKKINQIISENFSQFHDYYDGSKFTLEIVKP